MARWDPTSAADWEGALTAHYLRSDGPFGADPVRFLDVSPLQLARAIGLSDGAGDQALVAFVDASNVRQTLIDAFGSGMTPASAGDGPGFLRFLVLSCVVASDLEGSGDFRERLRSLMGWNSRPIGLVGIARLWRRLRDWCSHASERGEPYRQIELPDPGWKRQIGHSLLMAFPARGDVEHFASIVDGGDMHSARQVIAAIRRRLWFGQWSDGFQAAFADFERRYARGDRLLLDHPFWRAVVAIRDRGTQEIARPVELKMILEIDRDILFEVSADVAGIEFVGDIEALVGHVARERDRPEIATLARSLAAGGLVFSPRGWGSWSWERSDAWPRRIVSRLQDGRWKPSVGWRDLTGGWRLSDLVEEGDLARSEGVGELKRFRILGGVKDGSAYLGRRLVLPRIETGEIGTVCVRPGRVAQGSLDAQITGASIALASSGPLDGAWSIEFNEHGGDSTTPIMIRFAANASERVHEERRHVGWQEDEEAIGGTTTRRIQTRSRNAETLDADMSDLLEAIYAGGSGGWSEADLVPMLASAANGGASPWDLLRALRDGGCLDAVVATRWKARRWFLRPMRILQLDDYVVLDGAACTVSRDRFAAVVQSLGGEATVRGGCGRWSVPLPVARVSDPRALSNALETPLIRVDRISDFRAPSCWRQVPADIERRIRTSVWDWDRDVFGRGDDRRSLAGVELECWSRLNRDAPDLFRIAKAGRVTHYRSRNVALLEAHRLAGKPLFKNAAGYLERIGTVGYLPDIAVRRLCYTHLQAPGADEAGRYAYPCVAADSSWLTAALGPVVDGRVREETPLRRSWAGRRRFAALDAEARS